MKTVYSFILFSLIAACQAFNKNLQTKGNKHEDPFAILDRHVSQALAQHYLWPWSQLIRAAAALDAEEILEDSTIDSDAKNCQISLNVKHFKPQELNIKVKGRYILVEGKHKVGSGDQSSFIANHFMQRFALSPGSKPEEVSAILKQNGILCISSPVHELPPPPPDREVDIIVEKPDIENKPTEKPIEEMKPTSDITTEKILEEISTTASTPIEQQYFVETTTHLGKIRKKELKVTTKDNEVTKNVDENGLDYTPVESEK